MEVILATKQYEWAYFGVGILIGAGVAVAIQTMKPSPRELGLEPSPETTFRNDVQRLLSDTPSPEQDGEAEVELTAITLQHIP